MPGEVAAEIADTLEDLTPAWLEAALHDARVLAPGGTVERLDASPYGTGQFGFVVRASVTYGGELDADRRPPAKLIVKLPSRDAGSRGLAAAIGAYEAEVRCYEEIIPLTEVGSPMVYWSKLEAETNRFTLILEDLSDGWTVGDAIAGGTVEQIEAAMDALAALHAPVWDDPRLRELEWLASPGRTQALFDYVGPAVEPFRERFGDLIAPEHMDLVERLAPLGATYPRKAWQGPLVPVHGDFRLDNMMYAQGDDGLIAKIIDWQSVRLGPPMIDHGILLPSALSPELRREHQDRLLRRYHDGLVTRGVDGWSLEECLESFRQGCLYVFLLSVGMSVTLERSERGDQMFAALFTGSARLVDELGAAGFLET